MALLTVPTFDSAIATIRSRIRANNRNISTLPGSVFGDVFVTPQALSDVQQQALSYYTAQAQSLLDLLALKVDPDTLALMAQALDATVSEVLLDISVRIDDIGANFSKVRLQPQKATGIALLGRPNPLTANITIPTATVVRSGSGATYGTTSATTMFAASSPTYYDPNFQLFVIQVPVEATVAGSAGNTASQTLVDILTPVNGLPLVTNSDTLSGGTDIETDEAFAARILAAWQALGRTTPAGIADSIITNVPVGDVFVATYGSPFELRGFGRTDAYIKNRTEETVTETFSAFNHPTIAGAIRPSLLPVVGLVGTNSGAAVLQVDTTSALQGSVQSLDAIRFTTPPTFPVTISYLRNKIVADAQNVFNDSSFAPVNQQDPVSTLTASETAILVREAPRLDIDYTANITIVPGQSKPQVISAVRVNIQAYISTLTLGATVFQTDINEIVEKTAGVLRLSGTPFKFSPSNQSGVLSSISSTPNQIIVMLNLNIF